MRLTEEERSTVARLAAALVDPAKTSGVAAYGSKVAGYARPDSDYDVVIVAKRFREGVRYRYVDDPVPASALLVDEGVLFQDAQSSYLGEFVVGRLLNVYEPLSNPGLFQAVEHEYKKRVIVEALLDLASDYGEFSSRLVVPYDYFLFDKLHRRAAIYPPALYSYVHTYTSALGAENRAASVDGFRSAAESLQPRGFLVAGPDGVRLVPEKLKGDAFTRVQALFSVTARGGGSVRGARLRREGRAVGLQQGGALEAEEDEGSTAEVRPPGGPSFPAEAGRGGAHPGRVVPREGAGPSPGARHLLHH